MMWIKEDNRDIALGHVRMLAAHLKFFQSKVLQFLDENSVWDRSNLRRLPSATEEPTMTFPESMNWMKVREGTRHTNVLVGALLLRNGLFSAANANSSLDPLRMPSDAKLRTSFISRILQLHKRG
jgi:hypothetical protein